MRTATLPFIKSRFAKALAIAVASLALAACAVQPAEHAKLPDTVSTLAPSTWDVNVAPSPLETEAWWRQFGKRSTSS
jgi:hypothetical protein